MLVLRACALPLLLLSLVACAASGSAGGGGDGEDAEPTTPDADPLAPDADPLAPDAGTSPDAPAAGCAARELCDGVIDDDCDGTVDEDCGRCPLLTIECPTGCCPVALWEVDPAAIVGASLAVDAAGNVFFAYTVPGSGTWTAKIAIYDAEPGTWRVVPLGGGGYRNRVVVDAAGVVHVMTGTFSGALAYRRSTDRGAVFSEPETVGILNSGGTLFDMAIDSAGQPHAVYHGDAVGTSFPSLVYRRRLASGTWDAPVTLDATTLGPDAPAIALGFADRPHIVTTAYRPGDVTGEAKRYVYFNGNRWIVQNIEFNTQAGLFTGDGYFSGHSLRIAADDTRELLYSRRTAGGAGPEELVLARRGLGDDDAWTITPLTGVANYTTPTLLRDAAGERLAISDGVTLHRPAEAGGTIWASQPIEAIAGSGVAAARRGRYLYVAAGGGSARITVVDLGE